MDPDAADRRAWARHLGVDPDDLTPERLAEVLDGLVADDLPTAFGRPARETPDAPALLIGEDGDWLTHGELARRAAGVHAALARHGVGAGEPVLLCGGTSVALVVAYLGLLRAGAVVVLAHPAYTGSELAHLVGDSGARQALADPDPAARLEGLVDRVHDLGHLEEATEDPADPPPPAVPGPDAVALLAYTSGTTGTPKGVPLTHANVLSSIRAAMLAWRWSSRDVLVHALPLSHQHGLGGVHATLLAGSRAVVLPRFTPAGLGLAAECHGATVLFAVPAMYERLVADAEAAAHLRDLRLAVCGSAPLTPDLAHRVTAALGHAPLERYGSTEAGLDVSLPLAGPGAPGSVGLPLPGVRMRLRGGDGTDVADGEDGEVLLRGPQVFSGYRGDAEATAAAFDAGWFRSGDLGRRDPGTGYLRLTGRLKELVISGGMNVSPREVELALDDHPAVAEVGVAGLPSPRWGEEVTAWVVPAAGHTPDEQELLAHAAERLAPHKRPKRVHLVDELPRNSMGKLQRGRLEPPADAGAPPQPADVDTTDLDRALDRLRRADPGTAATETTGGTP